jgi:hypothetical protein
MPLLMRVFHSQGKEPFLRYLREYSTILFAGLSKPLASPLSTYISITCEE